MSISAISRTCDYPKYIVNRKYSKLLPIHRRMYVTQPDYYVSVPCGRCRLCKARLAKEWKIRIANELLTTPTHIIKSRPVPRVIFGTLTFNDDHYTDDESVFAEYFVKFRDNYRKKYGASPRYFAITDRGSQFGRLHLHFLLFNPVAYKIRKHYYTSVPWRNISVSELHDVKMWWPYGFVSYMAWVNSSAVANYIADYISGANLYKEEPVKHGKPICEKALKYKPKIYCSKGLGAKWLTEERFLEYNSGAPPIVVHNGFNYVLPRYYRTRIWPSEDYDYWAYDHRHHIRRAELYDYLYYIGNDVEKIRYKYLGKIITSEELNNKIEQNKIFLTPEYREYIPPKPILPDYDFYPKIFGNMWFPDDIYPDIPNYPY